MQDSLLKKLQPHLLAIGIFLAISFVYFSPVLSGKSLDQHDISQWLGASKEISDFRAETGEEALWTGYMFSGMPAYQISVLYPSNLMKHVNDVLWLWLPSPVNFLFMCLLGFYLLMISLRADYRLAIAGAIAYAFCSYFFVVIQAGHNSKAHAIALFPMVVAGVMMAYRSRMLLGAAITCIALSLQIYSNHLQITYYLAITILLFVVLELVRAVMEKGLPDFLKASLALGLAAGLAVLPNITNLWATYEYGKFSTRGASELTEKKVSTGLDKDYALDWSYGKLESFTLAIPDFKGGSSSYKLDKRSATYKAIAENAGDSQARSFVENVPLYWGDQPMTSGPVYNGAIPFLLFILSLFLLKGTIRIWLASVALLSLMLAWGRHFPYLTDFFFDYVPGYNKFRAVAMTLVIASFAIPFAGMLGVMKMMEPGADRGSMRKSLLRAFYIAGGLCLVFVLVPGLFCDFTGKSDEQLSQYDWLVAALREDRESALRTDAFRSFFFIAVGFALLWFWLGNKLKTGWMLAGLAFFILVDLWVVDKRYLNDTHFTSKTKAEQPFEMTAADRQILEDKSYYRVMNRSVSTFNDAGTSYFHRSIGGYHGAKLKRYQELIEYQIRNGNMNVLNMLNTKYFIVPNQQDNSTAVVPNPGALGPAWVVSDWKIVPDADAEMKALDSLDTRNSAVIDTRYEQLVAGLQKGVDSTASVRLIATAGKVAPNRLEYEVEGGKANLVVFSEIHYPAGWNAYLDGQPVEYLRANYVLRALAVPAGKHKVEFRFEPDVYSKGEQIAMAGSVLVLLVFTGGVLSGMRRSRA